MPRPKRTDQHPDLESAIRQIAWKQIAETGAASLSLRAIARELGITAPAIYNYFPRRDDLISALVFEAFSSFGQALETARDFQRPDDHAGRFRAIARAYRDWAVTHRQRYMLIFGTPLPDYKAAPQVEPAGRRSFQVLLDVIGAAYHAGKIHLPEGYVHATPGLTAQLQVLCGLGLNDEPTVIYLALEAWGKVHGLASLELYGHLPSFLGDALEDFLKSETEGYMKTFGLA